MASVNRVIIVGNLGRDPEVRAFPDGGIVANVTIATTETWKDKQTGERREATEWHRVVFRGGLAGIVEQYLRKGSQVYVEGSIKSRKYNDASGVEKSITEISASEMTMLGSRPDNNGQQDGRQDQGDRQQGNYQQRGSQQDNGSRQRDDGYQRNHSQQRDGARQAPAPQQSRQQPPPRAQAPRQGGSSGFDDMDDDIPFNDPLKSRALCLAI